MSDRPAPRKPDCELIGLWREPPPTEPGLVGVFKWAAWLYRQSQPEPQPLKEREAGG